MPISSDVILPLLLTASLAAQAAAGALLPLGMSVGLARLGAAVLGPRGSQDPGVAGGVTGFAVGLAVGSSLGVHLVARGRSVPARYAEALGGALAGALLLPVMPIDLDYPSA